MQLSRIAAPARAAMCPRTMQTLVTPSQVSAGLSLQTRGLRTRASAYRNGFKRPPPAKPVPDAAEATLCQPNVGQNTPFSRRRLKPNFFREIYNQKELEQVRAQQGKIDDFKAGDHIAVKVRADGLTKGKTKVFGGVVLARRNRGLHSTILLRMVYAKKWPVEQTFPIYSPWVVSIMKLKSGDYNKSKLYHLRSQTNKFFAVDVPKEFRKGSILIRSK